MENEKKSKWLKFFSVVGTIGLIIAMFFIGFFIGAYRVKDDEKIVAFADVGDTEYEWSFKGYTPSSWLGQNIWFIGNTCYFSGGSGSQYEINLTDFTWTSSPWTGYNSIQGQHVWYDGSNYRYSSSSSQYVLDVSTRTWTSSPWTGNLTTFQGNRVWSDGSNYYYSYSNNNYLLDTTNMTTTSVTFSGYNGINGQYVWNLGNNTYFSNGNLHYVLDVSTSTWSRVTFNGLTNFYGNYIYYDGSNYYYIQYDKCYILDASTLTWSVSDFALNNTYGVDYFHDSNNTSYYLNYAFFKREPASSGGGSSEPQPNPGSDTLVTYFSSSRIPINVDGLVYDSDAQSHTYIAPPYVGNAYFQFDAWTNIGEDEDLFMVQSVLELPGMYGANTQFYGLYFSLEDSYGSEDYSIVGTGSEVPYITGSFDYNDNSNYKFWVEVSWSNLDNVNFQRVTFTSSVDDTNSIVTDSVVCYVDSDTYIEFTFRHYFAGNSAITSDPNVLYAKGWGNRTYWLSTAFDSDSLYQNGYDTGYANGVNAGTTSGYNSGYSTGRGEGYNIGYGAGYNAGASDSQYTFVSLIGAVFDAPVQGFTGMFNFDVLGVNLKDFLLGLFSIAIVITIIKFVLVK